MRIVDIALLAALSASLSACAAPAVEGESEPTEPPTGESQDALRVAGQRRGRAIVAGQDHTCAIAREGTVYCWGSDQYGQIGDGDVTHSTKVSPVKVAGLAGVLTLSAGPYHTCAVTASGTVHCWGRRLNGVLGDSTSAEDAQADGGHFVPFQVPGITDAVWVAATRANTCVLRSNGMVKCWGNNRYGQIGDGSTTFRPAPTDVRTNGGGILVGATGLFAGDGKTCVTLADGRAVCWGYNQHGELGNGGTDSTPHPVLVNIDGVTELALGQMHSCTLDARGQTRCWGYMLSGMPGLVASGWSVTAWSDFNYTELTPNMPHGLGGGVERIEVGKLGEKGAWENTCAIMGDSSVKCWGNKNCWSNLFDPTLVSCTMGAGAGLPQDLPVWAVNVTGAVDIAVGGKHACVLRDTGEIRCWGKNHRGQFGNGTIDYGPNEYTNYDPTPIPGFTGRTQITLDSGYAHTCATLGGKQVCWGLGQSGQLGQGASSSSSLPVAVSGSGKAVSLSAGAYHTCQLQAGSVSGTGEVECWGSNGLGQVGDGSTLTSYNTPHWTFNHSAVAVSAGAYHTCVIDTSGGVSNHGYVSCWGYNGQGQLGDGGTASRAYPAGITLPKAAVSVAAGGYHSCASLVDGSVYCWGYNGYGQAGDPATVGSWVTVPRQVPGISGAVAVTTGQYHSCALLEWGDVFCWGLASDGQLGDTAGPSQSVTPVRVQVKGGPGGDFWLITAVAVSAGDYHTCALRLDGAVLCWGYNGHGQLGDGSTASARSAVTVREGSGTLGRAVAVSAGGYHSCAMLADGSARCWGWNGYGQLGNGNTAGATSAVKVVSCGNGTCEAGETAASCPADCGGCAGACGGASAEGCYCDEVCVNYGDCCANKCNVCGGACP